VQRRELKNRFFRSFGARRRAGFREKSDACERMFELKNKPKKGLSHRVCVAHIGSSFNEIRHLKGSKNERIFP
jgi:hypothetical protein